MLIITLPVKIKNLHHNKLAQSSPTYRKICIFWSFKLATRKSWSSIFEYIVNLSIVNAFFVMFLNRLTRSRSTLLVPPNLYNFSGFSLFRGSGWEFRALLCYASIFWENFVESVFKHFLQVNFLFGMFSLVFLVLFPFFV